VSLLLEPAAISTEREAFTATSRSGAALVVPAFGC